VFSLKSAANYFQPGQRKGDVGSSKVRPELIGPSPTNPEVYTDQGGSKQNAPPDGKICLHYVRE
jgi:hypothetical protein